MMNCEYMLVRPRQGLSTLQRSLQTLHLQELHVCLMLYLHGLRSLLVVRFNHESLIH